MRRARTAVLVIALALSLTSCTSTAISWLGDIPGSGLITYDCHNSAPEAAKVSGTIDMSVESSPYSIQLDKGEYPMLCGVRDTTGQATRVAVVTKESSAQGTTVTEVSSTGLPATVEIADGDQEIELHFGD